MKIRMDGTAVIEPLVDFDPIRFNVKKRSFRNRVEDIKLNFRSTEEGHSFFVLDKDTTHADSISREFVESFQKVVALSATAAISEEIWGPLPTMASYCNVEELYDVDEIDELYLQAAKKRGW